MLDLYFWVHLPADLSHNESQIQDNVANAKRSIQKLEAKVDKCKVKLSELNMNTEASDDDLYNCEDRIEMLLNKLVTQRRKLLKKSFDYCIVKLNSLEASLKTDDYIETNYVQKVAFFCRDVLKKIVQEVPMHLSEVDISVFLQLKEASAKCLRTILGRLNTRIVARVFAKRVQIAEDVETQKHFKGLENSNMLIE